MFERCSPATLRALKYYNNYSHTQFKHSKSFSAVFGQKFHSSASTSTDRNVNEQRIKLSNDQIKSFQEDGYLRVESFFTKEECQLLMDTIDIDPTISEKVMPMKDSEGRSSKLTLWFHLGKDTYSAFGRSKSLVEAAKDLIGGVEPYFFHTKIMLKEPKVGGKWEWHQDFGYWYPQGLLQPDKCFSCIMAIDHHTIENGCLQVLKGSHKLGRLDHGIFGGQAGVDPVRLEPSMKQFDLIHCELNPGDMLFTHSNLLHASAANYSNDWRRSMIIAFNGKDNEPIHGDLIPTYAPIDVLSDDHILQHGIVPHERNRGDFLTVEKNIDSFDQEIT